MRTPFFSILWAAGSFHHSSGIKESPSSLVTREEGILGMSVNLGCVFTSWTDWAAYREGTESCGSFLWWCFPSKITHGRLSERLTDLSKATYLEQSKHKTRLFQIHLTHYWHNSCSSWCANKANLLVGLGSFCCSCLSSASPKQRASRRSQSQMKPGTMSWPRSQAYCSLCLLLESHWMTCDCIIFGSPTGM